MSIYANKTIFIVLSMMLFVLSSCGGGKKDPLEDSNNSFNKETPKSLLPTTSFIKATNGNLKNTIKLTWQKKRFR